MKAQILSLALFFALFGFMKIDSADAQLPTPCPAIPPMAHLGPCVETPENCQSDGQCSDGQRCCATGCFRKCMDVGAQPKPSIPKACPPIPPMAHLGPCVETPENCQSDGQCSDGQRCCATGCFRKCMDVGAQPKPSIPKACPPIPPIAQLEPCVETPENCQADGQCSIGQRCCASGCFRKCMDV